MKLRASVIVPTFQGEKFLVHTLNSILRQERSVHEILVVDDGSMDASPEIARKLSPRIRVIKQPNAGVSSARNHGARIATGEVLLFLDQDDVWEPSLLEEQLGRLESDPGLALVYADSLVVDKEGHPQRRRSADLQQREGLVFEALLEGNFVSVETMAVRTEHFRSIAGFREDLFFMEDFAFCLQLAKLGPFGYSPQPLARYRVHENNLSRCRSSLLQEWVQILDEVVATEPNLSLSARAILASERRRRRGELVWQHLRDRKLESAEQVLDTAEPIRPVGLALKVHLLRALSRNGPPALTRAVLAKLPQQTVHGL